MGESAILFSQPNNCQISKMRETSRHGIYSIRKKGKKAIKLPMQPSPITGVSKKCKGQCKQKKDIEIKFLKENLDEDFLEKSKNNGTSRTWKDFIF